MCVFLFTSCAQVPAFLIFYGMEAALSGGVVKGGGTDYRSKMDATIY